MEAIDRHDLERLREDEAAARRAGFSLRPPVYQLGTRVNGTGVANARASRQEWEAMPAGSDVVGRLRDLIESENRADTVLPTAALRMLPDGSIVREGTSHRLPLAEPAFGQLLRRTGCPEPGAAATYLATIPPDRRAAEVNHWLADSKTEIMVRHRNSAGGGREAWAIVSPSYSVHDSDALAVEAWRYMREHIIPGDCRGEFSYDGFRAEVTLSWHSDVAPERYCAGEIFRAVAGLRTADDGTGSVRPFSGLHRNLCLNLIILDKAELDLGSRRHVGGGVGRFLARALREAVDRVRWFADRWSHAAGRTLDRSTVRDLPEDLPADEPETLVRGVYRGLQAAGTLALPGYRGETAIDLLTRAWLVEPALSPVGIVNGVTRAAHTADFGANPWVGRELERAGGRILAMDRLPFRAAK